MAHPLRIIATCAVAFGIMMIVGNAVRDTDASPNAVASGSTGDGSGPALWQRDDAPRAPIYPGTPPAAATPVPSAVIPVEIKGFVYLPESVTVAAGSRVAWTNQDNAPHTSTGLGDAAAALNSGSIVFGQTFTQEFDTPGTYPYYCVYHPNMLGTVIVTP